MKFNKHIVNITSNIGINFIFNIISLFTLPLFVTYYSSSLYGVFIMATALTDSLAMFDFGIGGALVRYTAEYTDDGDRHKYSAAISESLLIALALGLLFSLVMFGMSFVVVSVFNIEEAHSAIAKNIFQLSAVYTFILVLFNTTNRILEGNQIFYWRNIGKIPQIVVILSLYLAIKYYGLSFFVFVMLIMLGRLLPGIFNLIVIYTKGLLKDISFKKKLDGTILKSEFLRYSGNLFLIQIVAFCTFQADKFIIVTILTTSFVTVYAVITKPMYIIRTLDSQSLAILGPIFAKMGRTKDRALLKDVIRRGNLLHNLLVYPLVALLVVFIQPFMSFWMPQFYDYSYWGAIAGMIFLFVPFYGTLTRSFIYTGEITIVRNTNFWMALLNIIVSVTMTIYLGIGGVIVGTLTQAMIRVPIYIVVAKKVHGLGCRDMFPKEIFFNLLFVSMVSLGLYIARPYYSIDNWMSFFMILGTSTILVYAYGVYVLVDQKLYTFKESMVVRT